MRYPHYLTPAAQRVAVALQEQDARERASLDRDQCRVRAVAPDVAQFLYLEAVRGSARSIVELGTSAGYSTLHLAAAARHTGGRVRSVDRAAEKTAWARRTLQAAGLDDLVDLYTAEAAEFAQALAPGVDLLFIDLSVGTLVPLLEELKGKVAPRGLVFVDGYGTTEEASASPEWQELERTFSEDPRFALWLMPLRKSHLVALRLS